MGAEKIGFDLQVDYRDTKTGLVNHRNPYRLRIHKGQKFFERPKGSGIFYYENGDVIPAAELQRLALPKWKAHVTVEGKKLALEQAKDQELLKLRDRVNELEKERANKLLADAEVEKNVSYDKDETSKVPNNEFVLPTPQIDPKLASNLEALAKGAEV